MYRNISITIIFLLLVPTLVFAVVCNPDTTALQTLDADTTYNNLIVFNDYCSWSGFTPTSSSFDYDDTYLYVYRDSITDVDVDTGPDNVDLTTITVTVNKDGEASDNLYIPVKIINGVSPSTCTYSGSGDWEIDISENCIINDDYDLGSSSMIFTGNIGTFNINSTISAATFNIPENLTIYMDSEGILNVNDIAV